MSKYIQYSLIKKKKFVSIRVKFRLIPAKFQNFGNCLLMPDADSGKCEVPYIFKGDKQGKVSLEY